MQIQLKEFFKKNLGDIQNRRIQDMVVKLMPYNFRFHHITGKSNHIEDCFSRLTRQIRETEHFDIGEPILADHTTIKKIGTKSDVEIDDPWVEKLAKSASADFKYQIMIQHLEVKTKREHIPKDCEIAEMLSYYNKLSVFTLKDCR